MSDFLTLIIFCTKLKLFSKYNVKPTCSVFSPKSNSFLPHQIIKAHAHHFKKFKQCRKCIKK